MINIRQKATKGALWSFFGSTAAQIIRFGIGIVLARILTPREYGLVGMLAIFISVSDALVDSGFGQALIQKKAASKIDFSSVFFLNVIISLFLFLVILIFSPQIANFFNEPQLELLVIILAAGIIIRSFMVIQNTIFIKAIDFKIISAYRILSIICSGLIAIPMALKGYGVWSLVALTLTQNATYTFALWFKSPWKPNWQFSYSSIKELFGFGSRILGIGLLDNIFLHINKLVIGKYFSATDLGFYNRAYGYRDLISKNILMIIQSVVFPTFATFQDDLVRVRSNLRKVSEFSLFITIPMLALLAFTAEPLIIFLITDKWLPAVPYLQVLCLAGVFYPLSGIQVNILKAIGKVDVYFRMILSHKAFIIISIIIAIRWGVMGLVVAQVFNMFFIYFLGVLAIKKFLNESVLNQLWSVIKYVMIVIVIFYPIHLFINYYFRNDLIIILMQSVLSLSIYYVITSAIKFQGFVEFRRILKEVILPKLKRNK